jgi:hypothetical protein
MDNWTFNWAFDGALDRALDHGLWLDDGPGLLCDDGPVTWSGQTAAGDLGPIAGGELLSANGFFDDPISDKTDTGEQHYLAPRQARGEAAAHRRQSGKHR